MLLVQVVVDQVGNIPTNLGTWFPHHSKLEEEKEAVTEV